MKINDYLHNIYKKKFRSCPVAVPELFCCSTFKGGASISYAPISIVECVAINLLFRYRQYDIYKFNGF